MEIIRTIQQEERFRLELDALEPNVRRSDEFIRAAEWALARNPTSGFHISGTSVWMYIMNDIPGNPPVALYYTFNDDFVIFLSIKAFPES